MWQSVGLMSELSQRPYRHVYDLETRFRWHLFAPLEGCRHAEVTERRTAIDYAKILRDLADIHFPKAEKVLVQDNLNTHTPASLYEAFAAAEARRIIERFEWHSTPKHGSWLNLAESELAVLSGQARPERRMGALQRFRSTSRGGV